MATFPILIVPFFLKIDKVEAIDEIDKLCKFHENPTKNVDFVAYTRKRLTDGRWKPSHDIRSAGFQPVELKKQNRLTTSIGIRLQVIRNLGLVHDALGF